MMVDEFPDETPGRPAWLMTLADLALLLVGFFVFLQASQNLDRTALARGIRQGFGASAAAEAEALPAAMPVAAAAMNGFASGSAILPAAPDGLIAWARDAARDPRVTLTVTGSADGSPVDIDATSGSAAVLAAARASAVAAVLARANVVPAARLAIATAPITSRGQRSVLITTSFTGEPR